jgi:hypothetical protein
VSADGGVLLLREVAQGLGLFERMAACFTDHRDTSRIEHSLQELLAQRVLGLACGYEDLNDHDRLRDDPVLAMASGKTELSGRRSRTRDEGHMLAGRSTLNRLELTPKDAKPDARYSKIVLDDDAMARLLVELFIDQHEQPPKELILDLDATDDPLHGHQEGRFFHGYYRCYCYLPLYIFCGDFPLCALLRPSSIDGASGAVEQLERIVSQLRERWPEVRILIRADSGFAREAIMAWCEAKDVGYVLGLARNARLEKELEEPLTRLREQVDRTKQAAREFREFEYRTQKTWSRARRVVGKAECLPGKDNPRFVVTSLSVEQWEKQALYEQLYCARGDAENRIKEQQLDMFADRTSTKTMRGNQIRLWLSTLAYVLVATLRRVALHSTRLERAYCGTIRCQLLKLPTLVTVSVRRVVLSFSSVFPLQDVFALALERLRAWAPA